MFANLKQARRYLEPSQFRNCHRVAMAATENLKNSEVALIMALEQVEANMVHRRMGYNSLYQYATKALDLSESQAYTYIAIARKGREIPELVTAIAEELPTSKARRLCAVITVENQAEWLAKAKALSKHELEKEIAKVLPQSAVAEGSRFINGELMELKLGLTAQQVDQLKKVQDLLCNKKQEAVSLAQTVAETVTFYLERQDPLRKVAAYSGATRKIARVKKITSRPNTSDLSTSTSTSTQSASDLSTSTRSDSTPSDSTPSVNTQSTNIPSTNDSNTSALSASVSSAGASSASTPADHWQSAPKCLAATDAVTPGPDQGTRQIIKTTGRTAIPAAVERLVRQRDNNQCQFILADGSKCQETRWVELHHIVPIAFGGAHDINNITITCRGHHRVIHEYPNWRRENGVGQQRE